MNPQRAIPIVGARRPRAIAPLVIVSITSLMSLPGLADSASAEPSGGHSCAAVTTLLTNTSSGLLMPSESDFPFTAFTWTGAATSSLTIPRLLEFTGHAPGTAVEIVDLHHFFRSVAFHHPWHDRQQSKDVRKFERLIRVLERHLSDIRVYRVGAIWIDAYIVGTCGDDLTGLSTTLIET